jgi:hypothetical protein
MAVIGELDHVVMLGERHAELLYGSRDVASNNLPLPNCQNAAPAVLKSERS